MRIVFEVAPLIYSSCRLKFISSSGPHCWLASASINIMDFFWWLAVQFLHRLLASSWQPQKHRQESVNHGSSWQGKAPEFSWTVLWFSKPQSDFQKFLNWYPISKRLQTQQIAFVFTTDNFRSKLVTSFENWPALSFVLCLVDVSQWLS
jgi:hypothetical protein